MVQDTATRDYRSILIIGSIGIGNLLMFRPALERLRERYPHAHITVLVLKSIFRDVLDVDPLIDEVFIADFKSYAGISAKLKLFRDLRAQKYDLAITTFPANRLEYNLLAFLTGAAVRIGHRYPRKGLCSLSFLQNIRVAVRMHTHDVEQNLLLLEPLGIRQGVDGLTMQYPLTPANVAAGKAFIQAVGNVNKKYIGMHPGSSEEHMMSHKRWPVEHFKAIAEKLIEKYDCQVLVFGGPDEEDAIDAVCRIPGAYAVKQKPLREVAAIISHCRAFVTNDSGLMHVATAVGVPTTAVFGPTDHIRTAPYGAAHQVVRTGIDCSPCWPLKDVGFRAPCIYPQRRCMENLKENIVLDAVLKQI